MTDYTSKAATISDLKGLGSSPNRLPSTEKIVEIINHLILRKTDGKGLDETLNTKSGLLGISSVSGDMRQVIAAMRCGNGRAQLAFDISSTGCHSGIGSMLAALDVADAIVFTAGTPRHAATLRFWGSTSI